MEAGFETRRFFRAMLATAVLFTGFHDAFAKGVDAVPVLPAPDGTVIRVSSEPELQAAVSNMRSGTTVLIAPGTYRLTSTLNIGNRPLTNVALRGATKSYRLGVHSVA